MSGRRIGRVGPAQAPLAVLGAWGLTFLVAASSCNGDSDPKPDELVPSERVPDEELWEPLYGESEDAPSELRIRFGRLELPGANSGTDLAFLPNSGDPRRSEFLVTTREGTLVLGAVQEGEPEVIEVFPFAEEMSLSDACSPTNVLVDPGFETNGFIYVTYCKDLNTTQLVRYSFDRDSGMTDPAVIFETIREEADQGWHRFGSMDFEADGTLWMTVGDHELSEEAQDFTSPLGAIVRLIPNRDPEGAGHTTAEGNWAAQENAPEGMHPDVYAKGFRSPWRATRDKAGNFFVGDVGDHSIEEFNVVTSVGQNFGWDLKEGPCSENCESFVDPSISYSFDDEHIFIEEEPGASGNVKRAIWVGEIYEDPAFDRYHGLMNETVLFGDLFTAAIRAVTLADEAEPGGAGGAGGAGAEPFVGGNARAVDHQAVGALQYVTTVKMAPDGYLYALDLSGTLHVILLEE